MKKNQLTILTSALMFSANLIAMDSLHAKRGAGTALRSLPHTASAAVLDAAKPPRPGPSASASGGMASTPKRAVAARRADAETPLSPSGREVSLLTALDGTVEGLSHRISILQGLERTGIPARMTPDQIKAEIIALSLLEAELRKGTVAQDASTSLLTARIATLEARNTELEGEALSLKAQVAESHATLAAKTHDLALASTGASVMERQAAELADARALIADLTAQMVELESQLTSVSAEKILLTSRLEAAERKAAGLRDRASRLQATREAEDSDEDDRFSHITGRSHARKKRSGFDGGSVMSKRTGATRMSRMTTATAMTFKGLAEDGSDPISMFKAKYHINFSGTENPVTDVDALLHEDYRASLFPEARLVQLKKEGSLDETTHPVIGLAWENLTLERSRPGQESTAITKVIPSYSTKHTLGDPGSMEAIKTFLKTVATHQREFTKKLVGTILQSEAVEGNIVGVYMAPVAKPQVVTGKRQGFLFETFEDSPIALLLSSISLEHGDVVNTALTYYPNPARFKECYPSSLYQIISNTPAPSRGLAAAIAETSDEEDDASRHDDTGGTPERLKKPATAAAAVDGRGGDTGGSPIRFGVSGGIGSLSRTSSTLLTGSGRGLLSGSLSLRRMPNILERGGGGVRKEVPSAAASGAGVAGSVVADDE